MAEWQPYGGQLDMPSNKVNVLAAEEGKKHIWNIVLSTYAVCSSGRE